MALTCITYILRLLYNVDIFYIKKYKFIYIHEVHISLSEKKREKEIIVINTIEILDTHTLHYLITMMSFIYLSLLVLCFRSEQEYSGERIYIKLPLIKFLTYHISIFTFTRHNRLSIIPLNFLRPYATVILSLRFLQLIFLHLLIPVHIVELSLMHDR